MKKTLNVYFDYTCPYCYRSVTDLLDLLPDYPRLSIHWIPCEAHPRPEHAYVHSDLAAQAMLSAASQNIDLIQFNQAVFSAHFTAHRRIDDIQVLAHIVAGCGGDRSHTLSDLKCGLYRQDILENNRLVWDTLQFEAVPCYESGGSLLASHEDVMTSEKQLKKFLDALMA